MEDKLLKNPRITTYETMYGCTGSSSVFAGRDLTEKDFKKWFKHYLRRMGKAIRYIGVIAEYDDEEFDVCDLTSYWYNVEMSHDPSIPFC